MIERDQRAAHAVTRPCSCANAYPVDLAGDSLCNRFPADAADDGPYIHDDKARLHETLPSLANALSARANIANVLLDSFIVSATPYDELRTRYDDGTWDRKRFAGAHILFPERTSEYDYLNAIIGSQ
jgi:hypothetical protein